MTGVQVVGLRGDFTFDEAIRHFSDAGGDVALLDPAKVCGKDHLRSAVMHAERAFAEGTNRSKTLLTEVILYAACERQIDRALRKMRPPEGSHAVVAVVIGVEGDLRLGELGAERDDALCEASPAKAEALGAEMFCGILPEEAVLEQLAMVDLMKQRLTASIRPTSKGQLYIGRIFHQLWQAQTLPRPSI